MDENSLRNGIADFSADIFESATSPLIKLPTSIKMLISAIGNGSGDDPFLGISFGDLGASLTTIVENIGNSLQPVGYALCFLFFLIALLELAMSERMTLEYFVKFFSKFVIGFAVVYFWKDIYNICRQMGPALANTITSTPPLATSPNFHAAFREYVGNNGGAAWLVLLLASFLVGAVLLLATCAIVAVTYVIVFTWVLEMGIRGAFLPIACALLSDDGWRGAGGRYIRRFLAVCCQGAVMTCIASVYAGVVAPIVNSISTSATTTTSVGIFTTNSDSLKFVWSLASSIIVMVALSVAVVSVMFKSSSIVNDVFGG